MKEVKLNPVDGSAFPPAYSGMFFIELNHSCINGRFLASYNPDSREFEVNQSIGGGESLHFSVSYKAVSAWACYAYETAEERIDNIIGRSLLFIEDDIAGSNLTEKAKRDIAEKIFVAMDEIDFLVQFKDAIISHAKLHTESQIDESIEPEDAVQIFKDAAILSYLNENKKQ